MHLCVFLSTKIIQHTQKPSNLLERKDLHFFILTVFDIIRAQKAYLIEIKYIPEKLFSGRNIFLVAAMEILKKPVKETKSVTGGGAT